MFTVLIFAPGGTVQTAPQRCWVTCWRIVRSSRLLGMSAVIQIHDGAHAIAWRTLVATGAAGRCRLPVLAGECVATLKRTGRSVAAIAYSGVDLTLLEALPTLDVPPGKEPDDG